MQANNSSFPPDVRFDFPLTRPHCGIALGNGTLDILVWGDARLCLTIARAGFGEYRGDNAFATFARARELLEAGDESGLRELFANAPKDAATPPAPRQIGNALWEIRFTDEARPVAGTLKADGTLEIQLSNARIIVVEAAMDEEVAWLDGAADARWELRSSCEENRDVSAPLEIEISDGRGFVQERCHGESLALMVRKREDLLFLATATGETEEAAKAAVSRARSKPDINPIYYWRQFWRSAPRVFWPDAQLQRLWNIALFKQAQASATTDATIDFIAAFTALSVRSQSDGIQVLPLVPRGWSELSFDNIRCKGAFLIGADVKDGVVVEVRVQSEKGGVLRLHPNAQTEVEREMAAGETWVWRAK